MLRRLLIASLGFILASCASHQVPATVATVDGRPISRQELDSYLSYAIAFDRLAYPDSAQAACQRQPSSAACLKLRDDVLGRLIQERIVLTYARDHHIALTALDRLHIRVELTTLSAAKSPTAQLFRKHQVTRSFMTSLLERQVIVQHVEDRIAGAQARRGPELHLGRLLVPVPAGASHQIVFQQTVAIAGGAAVPAGTQQRTEWIAPFRLSAAVRNALSGARPGDYVGPFQRDNGFLLFQMLGRHVHRYGKPARQHLTARYFHAWLAQRLLQAHLRCRDSKQRWAACPASVIKLA